MSNTKSMGREYSISLQGNWNQVSEIVNVTKDIIENTRSDLSLVSTANDLEDRLLQGYLVPQKEESFKQYKTRFIQAFLGQGIKAKIFSVWLGKRVRFEFQLTQNEGESTLRVFSVVKEGKYQTTISASGDYLERGTSISDALKETLEEDSIIHSYKSIDKVI